MQIRTLYDYKYLSSFLPNFFCKRSSGTYALSMGFFESTGNENFTYKISMVFIMRGHFVNKPSKTFYESIVHPIFSHHELVVYAKNVPQTHLENWFQPEPWEPIPL